MYLFIIPRIMKLNTILFISFNYFFMIIYIDYYRDFLANNNFIIKKIFYI